MFLPSDIPHYVQHINPQNWQNICWLIYKIVDVADISVENNTSYKMNLSIM